MVYTVRLAFASLPVLDAGEDAAVEVLGEVFVEDA